VAACEVLAFHRVLERNASVIEPFLRVEDPLTRCTAWRVVAYAVLPVSADLYTAAIADDDPSVRAAALEAGAWCGVPEVLSFIREVGVTAPLEHSQVVPLLGIIGTDDDHTLIESLGCMEALGPVRYALLAAGGNTRFMEHILSGLESADPKSAVAAGAAFSRLTGLNIDSQNIAIVPADGASPDDEFEQEFADQLTLPDAMAARREWKLMTDRRGTARHMAAGRSLDALDAATFNVIDMQARYEICLRSRFHGLWTGTPVELERFPQRAR
jgi:hypothetical protein